MLTLPFVGGFSSVKSSKILLRVSLEAEPGPCLKAALLFSELLLPCLCIPSLPWLATLRICPLELREGHGGWRGTQTGDRRASVPRSSIGSHSVSLRRDSELEVHGSAWAE